MAPKKNYTPEQMAHALALVQKGTPVATAAKRAGVPRITLLYKASGKSPRECAMGPAASLSPAEEDILVRWILQLSKIHYPISKVQLIDSVEYIIKKKPRKHHFVNGRPGDKWFRNFLKRHPDLSTRISQNLTISRENVSEQQIRNWFSEIKDFLTIEQLLQITEDPNRVFNTDESAFFFSRKGDRVITRKGEKNVYTVSGDEKENLTVLVTANAAGRLPPPMIVVAYARVPSYISTSVPQEWGIGTSENGWMCGATFYGYITNIFVPWLNTQNIERPVLLFMDGHVSHMTLHLSEFCLENGIILIALFPNSTHLLQPMDVSVFRPLKAAWKKEVYNNWRIENYGKKLQKQNFASVFKNALDHITPDTIKNGFRVSGLCPFNVDNVNFNKISTHKRSKPKQDGINIYITLKTIEEQIGHQKTTEFRQLFENGNRCKMEDTSLFLLWQTFYKGTKENNQEAPQKNNQEAPKEHDQEAPQEYNQEAPQENNQEAPQEYNQKAPQENNQEAPQEYNQEAPQENNQEALQENNQGIIKLPKGNVIEEKFQEIEKKNNEDSLPTTSCNPSLPSTSHKTHSFATTVSPLSNSNLPFDVPSPFKGALFWPDNTVSAKKRKNKEKIPSVVTSAAWQNYHRKKEQEKLKKIEDKKTKAILREQNKLERLKKVAEGVKKSVFDEGGSKIKIPIKNQKRLKNKKCDTSSDSETDEEEWVPSESNTESHDSDDELNEDKQVSYGKSIKEGDYVLVAFPSEKNSYKNYMCVVQELIGYTDAEVVGMICCNEKKTLFKLNENDVSVIRLSQIIKKMLFPKMIIAGDRIKYEFFEPADVHDCLF